MKTEIKNGDFIGERALFASRDIRVTNSHFHDGESPLKESCNIEVVSSRFSWKYPLWYCNDVKVFDTVFYETARSGIWYTKNIEMSNSRIDAPKTFRRAEGITLSSVTLDNALETMWYCKDIRLESVRVKGDYFGLSSENVYAENLEIYGNYAFDGAKNIEIHNARLISKDAFWNAENVTVYDSLIEGEYLGWNSKNVRLVNCTIESNQGMCYMENLILESCILNNTDLAFEYSTVNASINSYVDSVKNISGGRVICERIGEIIMDEKFIDPEKTEICELMPESVS
jgi:hypothetical protein